MECINGTIDTTGVNIIDRRIGNTNYWNKEQFCVANFTCCTIAAEQPTLSVVPVADGCGYRNINGIGVRIMAEKPNEAQFGNY